LSRRFVCWAMLLTVPSALLGQTPSAILHTQGGVWVNNYEANDSSAIFTGDVIETRPGFSANLMLEGSSVLIQPESVTKFESDLLALEHGGVSVGTSRSFKVRVKCITVTPVANEWTQYEVSDVNGTIQVAARKNDVHVEVAGHQKPSGDNAGSQGGSVKEGEQKNYIESDLCGGPPRKGGASAIDPKWIAIGAGGAGVLIWALIHGGGGSSPTPISNSTP
jgi:hypothetical protein